jgi:ATP-dependent Clp protease adaptor protein ClpS
MSPGYLAASTAQPDLAEPQTSQETRLVPRFRVLIHNDDVTPMDFVVHVLMQIFRCTLEDAQRIMLEAHHQQIALVCILPLEEAEFRIDQAHALARGNKFPLNFSLEPE